MEQFVAAYEEVLSTFPVIDQSSNEFAEKIIDNINNNLSGRIDQNNDLEDVIYGLLPLNADERNLALRNPAKAAQSGIAAGIAIATTFALFGENGFKTRSDAFRHSYWNWLMSDCCSVEWARAFATAHESPNPNNDDKRMDLNNNMIGRRVFASNPSASGFQAQTILLNYNLLWLNEVQKNVVVGINYLVYLRPMQSLTVFDDGPSFDDIYEIMFGGKVLGTTPKGGSRAFEFSQIPSGTYNLGIRCQLDGTKGGCGFQIILKGAMRLSSGQSQTPQIVIQESETHRDQLIFPNMNARRIDEG